MKIPVVILAVLAVATGAYLNFRPAKDRPAPVDPASMHEGTLTMKTDSEEVFKRALWRRPAPDDKILHAERREWTKDSREGAARWQWFLAVEPGPVLKKWLRERNPFSVHPAGGAEINGAPEWFPRDLSGFEIQTGGTKGSLVFLFSRDGNTLYATSSGTGFTTAAPATAAARKTSTNASIQGRLPVSSPPTSLQP